MFVSEDTADSIPVQIGDLLAEKYRVEKILGAGGMGVVVAARHVDLGELRAIKFLRDPIEGGKDAIERFLREARAAVRLKSKHVVRVHDVGKLQSGAPYMVMEHLEGIDLKDMLGRGRLPPVPDCVDLILQALEAMAEAHARGIVHRDLKPANLFVTRDGDGKKCLKVLDFGISKLLETGDQRMDMTGTNALLGSPYYMSPEQIMSTRDVDARTDIWSLGVVLYELLTGRVPYEGKNIGAQCALLMKTTAPKPSTIAPRTVPGGLDDVVLAALSREPTDRGRDVSNFARGLAPFGGPDAMAILDRVERMTRGEVRMTDDSGDLAYLKTVPSHVPDELARMMLEADAIPSEMMRERDVDDAVPTLVTGKQDALPLTQPVATLPSALPMSQSTKATWGGSRREPVEPSPWSRVLLVVAALVSAMVGAGMAFFALREAPESQGRAPAAPLEAKRPAPAPSEGGGSERDRSKDGDGARNVGPSPSATSAGAAAAPPSASIAQEVVPDKPRVQPRAEPGPAAPAKAPIGPAPSPLPRDTHTRGGDPSPKPKGDPFGDGRN